MEHGITSPSLANIHKLSCYFDVSIDNLIFIPLDDGNILDNLSSQHTQDIDMQTQKEKWFDFEDIERRYANKRYHVYYYDTDRDKRVEEGSIRKGLLSTHQLVSPKAIKTDAEISRYKYSGYMVFESASTLVIYMTCKSRKERAFITLPAHNSLKPYIGGAGLALSLSTGSASRPCAHKIVLSSEDIPRASFAELSDLLDLHPIDQRIYMNHEYDVKAYELIKSIQRMRLKT